MVNERRIERWGLRLMLGLLPGLCAGGCAPGIDMSPCDEDRPCEGRSRVCDLDTLECVAAEVDVSSTENPAPASFADKIIPFFRGEICLPLEAESGSALPVLMRPCLHPCVATTSFEFRHSFSCVGSRCDALALMWIVGSNATACPPDAFGTFDAAQCQYGTEVEFTIGTETSNGPISGTMNLEVPFLTNADMEAIAASPGDQALLDQRVGQYPQQANRIPNGQSISLLSSNPVPPASCRDGACDCYPIGF